MSRPTRLVLSGEKLKQVTRNFSVLADLSTKESGGDLVLTKDLLFPGDTKKWEMFYDIIIPEDSYKYTTPLFIFGKDGKIGINPKRGTKEDALQIIDFLSDKKEEAAAEYLRKVATKQINAPPTIAINKRKQEMINRKAKILSNLRREYGYYNNYTYKKGGSSKPSRRSTRRRRH